MRARGLISQYSAVSTIMIQTDPWTLGLKGGMQLQNDESAYKFFLFESDGGQQFMNDNTVQNKVRMHRDNKPLCELASVQTADFKLCLPAGLRKPYTDLSRITLTTVLCGLCGVDYIEDSIIISTNY